MNSTFANSGPTRSAAASVQIRKSLGKDFELDLSVALPPGITILFGSSGAGKTTLLNCVAGLVHPDHGRIAIRGKIFFDSEQGISISPQQRKVGYVFQDLALFPHLSVLNNVEYGLFHLDREQRQQRSAAILDSFRIAHLGSRKPTEISGGERQRVALARAL